MLIFLVALMGTPVEPAPQLGPLPAALVAKIEPLQVPAATPVGDLMTSLTAQLRPKGCSDYKFACKLRPNGTGGFDVEPGPIEVEIRVDVTKAP